MAYLLARGMENPISTCFSATGEVLCHRFAALEIAGFSRALCRERMKHDEFSHGIGGGVSARRVSGAGFALVEEALSGYLPEVDTDPGAVCPPRLAAAMRYSVLGGGKRLRPVLCLMAAEACGTGREAALPAACAVEMVHTYSLIHDDLPAMDDDDLRRGRSTCHREFDEATAILTGDGLLTLAFEVIARNVRPVAAALRCVAILAEAAGPSGMVAGQMADLQAEGRAETWNQGRQHGTVVETTGTLAALEGIHRRKTGALFRAIAHGCCDCGSDRGMYRCARPLR